MTAISKNNKYFGPNLHLAEDSAIPLHHQIAEAVFKEIVKLRVPSGTCIIPERMMAQKLNLNRSTVHKGYMKLLEDGVIEQRNGGRLYYISKDISNKYKISLFPSIGIVMPYKMSTYINPSNFMTLDYLAGIMDEASEIGFSVTFISLPSLDEDKKIIHEWAENLFSKLSGLIYLGCRSGENDTATELLLNEKSIPQVFLTGISNLPHISSVLADPKPGLLSATQHLRENGHSNVGILSFEVNKGKEFKSFARDRHQTMLQAIRETGLNCPNEWIAQKCDTRDNIRKELKKILSKKEHPTAFLCQNDEVAANVSLVLHELNVKIPDEISLIGFDDARYAVDTVPQLTTVKVPRYIMGRKSVSLLIDLLENINNSKALKLYVPTSLVIRSSTGKVPAPRKVFAL
ncbi:MAG: hypothetical protein A2017_04640 [Lentisphaerae bacterium GWF2_44_16]|nr:MAG: hypothetical protein A2017_04640 [Lentisphaerae bacterium GWF2_44_16]